MVGGPAAALQAALSGYTHAFAPVKRRLKAGCSQDCLPHEFAEIADLGKLGDIARECVRHNGGQAPIISGLLTVAALILT
jgi:hypothetical protein